MEALEYIEYNDRIRIAVHSDSDLMEPEQDLPYGSIVFRRSGYRDQDDKPELPELTRDEIKQNAHDICGLLDMPSLLRVSSEAYNYRHDYNNATDCINDVIGVWYRDGNYSEASDTIELIANIKGYQVAAGTSTEYSQGDAIEYIIALPNTSADPIGETYAQGVQDEYAAWAFGDGYGYVIEELIDDEWGGKRSMLVGASMVTYQVATLDTC